MGYLIDSSVLIAAERGDLDLPGLRRRAGGEAVALAAITVSELLHGVHRADGPVRRRRREAFVEGILSRLPVRVFDLHVARTHAALWAELARAGVSIGAHDLLIAATALCDGWTVVTRNLRDFGKVPDLESVVW
jgi:tRNA(fMet)-specific endonuclease VapC